MTVTARRTVPGAFSAAAVDLLVARMIRGETGIPLFQKELLIKGEWML